MQLTESAQRNELFEMLLEDEGLGDSKVPSIPRAVRPPELPLSFSQQRLWVLDQLEPGTAQYNVSGLVRLRGKLNVDALHQALNEVVRRHEALRTVFERGPTGPVQRIAAPFAIELPRVDAAGDPSQAMQRALAESQRGFDLARGPLIRAQLIQVAKDEQLLALTLHHVVSDGWSVSVLVSELSSHYAAAAAGRPFALPELPIQYPDYTLWQRGWLEGARLEEQLAWWKAKLAGAPSSIDLPIDRPRPPVQTFNGSSVTLQIPQPLTAALRALSREREATLFMTLFAAFNVLLSRCSGQEDLVVGTSLANRGRTELEGLIGFFVNTLALRTDVRGNPTFLALLEQVRQSTLEAYANQDAPFEQVVGALQPERDLARNPLFQVMFDLVNVPRSALTLPGLELQLEEPNTGTSKFELTVAVEERGSGLQVDFEFNTDLFDPGTITRLGAHYLRLLESIAQNPSQPIAQLELLGDEVRRLQDGWNATEKTWPELVPFHHLFEAQVVRTPDAIAVTEDGGALTYGELNAQANQIAHALRSEGVGPETIVGVLHERGVGYLAAMIGIWKAGGAFLPLDPAVPALRLAKVCDEAKCPLVLAQAAHLELARELSAQPVMLNTLIGSEASTSNPVWVSGLRDLAYVLFTSGSTGLPKGAMITHDGLTNHVLAMAELMGFTASDCMAQTARQSFDVSVWQCVAPLLNGGRVAVLPDECGRDALALLSRLEAQKVTICELVPTQLGLMLDALERLPSPSSLRWMISTGEPLTADLCARWFARLPQTPMINAYGPTECSDDVTCLKLFEAPADRKTGSIPIHGTLPNFQVYVLDAHLARVPLGVAGELCIGGLGVGRGYLGDAAKTAPSFVPNPFSSVPGARLYRSGDRVRLLADGSLETLGRADHQIKIRGVRIEIGEIESALTGHPQLEEVLVVARADASGEKAVVAYVVNRAGAAPSARQLRRYLKERLPVQMIPSAFVALDALPLLANGKVNRHALPAPAAVSADRDEGYVAPSSDLERTLCELWTRLLNVERVGIEDDFFELGGHSLLATQLISRIQQTLGQQLSLRGFFEGPTIAGITAALGSGTEKATLAPTRRERPQKLPLSFSQQRLWLIDQLDPGLFAYNIAAALRLQGVLDVDALQRSLGEIVRRHEVLRTTFSSVQGEAAQVIHPAAPFPLPQTSLVELPSEGAQARVRALALEDSERPFDLEKGPLIRGALLKLSDHEQVLLLNVHHVVSDGWSMGVLVGELKALYTAFSRGGASPLPELSLQFADYTLWQREQLSEAQLKAPLDYWRQKLGGPLPVLELATDRPRPAVPSFKGAAIPFTLPPALGQALEELALREGATLFMTLLAAFKVLLHRHTGQTDLVVGTPVANRTHRELEGLIGFFANTLPLRSHFEPGLSFRDLLAQVKETSLEAFAQQDVPFELLVEKLQPQRDPSRHPIFQTMFVLQNVPTPVLEQDGLRLEEIEVGFTAAKFDLLLSLEEGPCGLSGTLEYSSDLFDSGTAERMVARLRVLLEEIVQAPQRPLSELEILPKEEAHLQRVALNATQIDNGFEKPLHLLFEEQVLRTPTGIAVELDGVSLTYAELNARSNQLAHRLRAWGVGPDVCVGLFLDRSLEMAAGVLAVLKAGGAFVPLDPTYPSERLAFMVEDVGAPVVLTQAHLLPELPPHHARVFCLDTQGSELEGESTSNPTPLAGPEHLVYVIYTSGSTGRPKGVCLPHRAMTNLLQWHLRTLRRNARTAQLASLSFDASIHEMFAAWASGGTLVIVPEPLRRDVEGLAAFLGANAIEKIVVPVVILQQLAELFERRPEVLQGLREVMATGEQLVITQPIIRLFQQLKGCVLHNHYGPSETHVVTSFTLSATPQAWPAHPPVGKPIDNTECFVLDAALQLMPLGAVGELYLGGVGLARGYLNRPELTAERFVAHPFTPGARLYRTGDLARYLPDGDLEFLGRIDHQVKIRGFRVELSEVEGALLLHPGVHQAVVLARTDDGAAARLVAYLVANAAPPSSSELRAHLLTKLPEYMVPSAFVVLPALRLTSNGKVDRRALPAPDAARPELASVFQSPSTDAERVVAGIWAELLGIERVGLRDSFFELGGHSLLATRVVAALRDIFQVELPLRALFTTPTVEGLVAELARLHSSREVAEQIAATYLELSALSEAEVLAQLDRPTAA